MSRHFEDEIRDAFEDLTGEVPAGLRGRVISRAVAAGRPVSVVDRVRHALRPGPRLLLAGAAVAALLIAVGVYGSQRGTGQPSRGGTVAPTSQLAFGRLPDATLHPGQHGGAGGGPAVAPYFGPAKLTWAGQLPQVPADAPVFALAHAGQADADAFARLLGGTATAPAGGVGPAYRVPGRFILQVALDDPILGLPSYVLNSDAPGASAGQGVTEASAAGAADAFLSSRHILPTWPARVSQASFVPVGSQGKYFNVLYQRGVPVVRGLDAGLVNGEGDPAGVLVVLDSAGAAVHVEGIVPRTEAPARYPLRSGGSAIIEALGAQPLFQEPGAPPAVALTHADLVYIGVRGRDRDYIEPAYLFTGTFTLGGQTYEKRVLVSALAGRARQLDASPSPTTP